MQKPSIFLTHLYAQELSIYGDIGNIIALRYNLEKMGYPVIVQTPKVGEALPEHTDWYFIGGGADRDQGDITADLLSKKERILHDIIEDDIPLLAICGGYQLLGMQFIAGDASVLAGVGLFPVVTQSASAHVKDRCVSNMVCRSLHPDIPGMLVGFENHGGQTSAADGTFVPLAQVVSGNGNAWKSKYEGCIVANAIGSYLHGPCLAKNPALMTFFINCILVNKGLSVPDKDTLDFSLENAVHDALVSRFS
jgi:lipid II isoglutaminyl synthase (glutamine-hydrolysing)